MNILEDFISSIQDFLINNKNCDNNLVRKHTKKLEGLGDVSFPKNISNWYQYIKCKTGETNQKSIFDFKYPDIEENSVLSLLKEKSKCWSAEVNKTVINNENVHIFIKRSPDLYRNAIKNVIQLNAKYGSSNIISKSVEFVINLDVKNVNYQVIDLSVLRVIILRDIALNLVNFMSSPSHKSCKIYLVTNLKENDSRQILCGPVINEQGVKNSCTAQEIFNKRSSDMRMMAQHKYGVQVKPNSSWEKYFEELGKASVTIEMLTNKPQKAINIKMNDLQSANKGAAFIFYNCARLSALFKEFDKKILTKEYPEFPKIEEIDFSVLNQEEEWELFYVYILQFPLVVKSCIKDIENGNLNPQHLVSFLSNMSSVFSVYYRRVRILTNPKEHMVSLIHARIYLLKALQCVFHNALGLLNIDPVKEM